MGPSRQPEDHYRAVCRALATESSELRLFLTKVFTNDVELRKIEHAAGTSVVELKKLEFNDWVSETIAVFLVTQNSTPTPKSLEDQLSFTIVEINRVYD